MACQGRYIKLLKSDKEERKYEQPVSTVNFYSGKAPIDVIRKRLDAIVAANLWLVGEYRKNPDTGDSPTLWVPESQENKTYFYSVDDVILRSGMSSRQIERITKPFLVNHGKAGRAKAPAPLFKVTVMSCTDNTFCVVISLCHTLGDGHTFYSIYGMLAGTTPITRMNPNRVDERERQIELIGEKKVAWFKSITTLLPLIVKMLFSKHKPIYRYINLDWVAMQKASYIPTHDAPYVSTNDILTALFMDKLGMDFGVMAVDARGRLPALTEDLAGTYEAPVFLLKNESYTPQTIRHILISRQSSSWKAPGRWASLFMNIGIVTSWASWDVSMPFADCELRLHIPIFSKPAPPILAVLWKPSIDTLAVLLNANSKVLKRFGSHPALGGPVLQDDL